MSTLNKWYKKLKKPAWAPTPETLGLTWTLLFPIIFIVYLNVGYGVFKGDMDPIIFILLNINLASNILYIPFQFNIKNLKLASIDIAVTWVTSVIVIAYVWPYSELLALVLFPYFIWVSFIGFLQFSILMSNR